MANKTPGKRKPAAKKGKGPTDPGPRQPSKAGRAPSNDKANQQQSVVDSLWNALTKVSVVGGIVALPEELARVLATIAERVFGLVMAEGVLPGRKHALLLLPYTLSRVVEELSARQGTIVGTHADTKSIEDALVKAMISDSPAEFEAQLKAIMDKWALDSALDPGLGAGDRTRKIRM